MNDLDSGIVCPSTWLQRSSGSPSQRGLPGECIVIVRPCQPLVCSANQPNFETFRVFLISQDRIHMKLLT